MILSNSSKHFFLRSIFAVLIVQLFFSLNSPVWSQELKPSAVVLGLNSNATPGFSEQFLLHNLRNELSLNYDFSHQSTFEKALLKLESSAENLACLHLNCILKVHATFPRLSLFLLKSWPVEKRLTLVMINENQQWRVKHEDCKICNLSSEDMLKNIVLRMESYAYPPMVMKYSSLQKLATSTSPESVKVKADALIPKSSSNKILKEPELQKSFLTPKEKAKFTLKDLQFKIAQKRYNLLIWQKIKKDLMFFRQKNRNQSVKNLKVRLRLQIDQFGKVIERRLLTASGSDKFNKTILDSVDLLKLPPPMELLIRLPPYVVTILIQP